MAEPALDMDRFLASLADSSPPLQANLTLRALWYDAKQRPESAERAASADLSLSGYRVQAYLLRKAGQDGPARIAYWKAGLRPWSGSSESEWRDIAEAVLAELPVAGAYGA